ncbi:hypothetical protein RUM43_003427 [Polyplax serrata]|uniref:C2H2-type domain-containing protein n=1 Tax=Polyplax serrata TaxID=468196 RepID=A0AAN8NWP1_POLSC
MSSNEELPLNCKNAANTGECLDTQKKMKVKRELVKRSACKRCGEMLKTSDVEFHEKKHKEGPEYKCDLCERAFVCHLSYHRHGSRVHNKQNKCDKCGKIFTKTDYLIRHLKFGHAEKTYMCHLCQFATSESNQLRMHLDKRHLKNYTLFCSICSKGFFDKSSLKEHENMHTGATPYQCEVCGMIFKIKCTLRAHKLKFHPHLFPHVCGVCGKGLSTKKGLESHLKLHAENRKFVCDICGRHLNTPRSLLEHKRLHTKERPFECELCMKSYPAQKHLVRHVRLVHTGEQPEKKHECRHCKKKYASLPACLSHQKVCADIRVLLIST